MSLKKTIILSMVLAGFSAMVSQIVFMREFLVVFYGNEISIGLILASWLVWGAFGSAFLGRYSDRIQGRIGVFAACQFALAFIFPLTLLATRTAKNFMGITIGEIIGYPPMMLATFVVLSLQCTIMGFMFSMACRMYRDLAGSSEESIARVYVMEAVGALSGGLLASYFMIRYMNSATILLMLSLFNLSGSFFMWRHARTNRGRKTASAITVFFIVAGMVAFYAGGGSLLRDISLRQLWSGFEMLGSKDSIYGNITVTERGEQRSFYENGLHLYTVPDRLSAEESVHFALLQVKNPTKVLLIGGGVGGLLEETLKYPLKRIDYVELDSTIITMAKKYLQKKDSKILTNPKVNIINEDGRFFVKKRPCVYDCVIIALGDPYTAQINRFYTVEFFEELEKILDETGVVGFALTSSENYLSEELREYLRSIYLSARKVFPEVLVIPGDTAHFVLSEKAPLVYNTDVLAERMREKGINAVYVQDYYLRSKLSEERMEYIASEIERDGDVRVNRDFRPVSYYYATVFWGTQFDAPVFRRILHMVKPENVWLSVCLFCFAILIFGFFSGRRLGKRTALLAIMTTGFAEIIFQITAILSFQVIYGYVFYKLGIIVTSFMVGLALGGWLIARRITDISDDLKVFSWTQVSICLYPLVLPLAFLWLSGTDSDTVSWLGSNVIFPFLPVIAGIIGGIQFPLANKLYLENRDQMGRVAGLSYGLDLFGACLGALLASAFLVPILGIFQTCFLAALINVTVLTLLLLALGRKT
jgi:spermidine synthase